MKKSLILVCMASCFPLAASAQFGERATTKAVCTKLCIEMDPEHPIKEASQKRLADIREKKKAEREPGKIKELENAEEREIARHQDDLERLCRKICATNPED